VIKSHSMMSDAVIVALILGGFSIVPATLTVVLGILNRDSLKNTNTSIKDLKISTDGKMDKLLKLTAQAEHAKGKLEGAEGKHER
jgi:hypothetical protein